MPARLAVALVVLAAIGNACGVALPGGTSPSRPSTTITVFAASSLTAAYTAIGSDFQESHPGVVVTFSFGGSSTLVAQIQQGATGDVFAAADQPNMQKLVGAGLTADAPRVFARNRLEIVVEAGNPKHIVSLADLAPPGPGVVLLAPAGSSRGLSGAALRKARVDLTTA